MKNTIGFGNNLSEMINNTQFYYSWFALCCCEEPSSSTRGQCLPSDDGSRLALMRQQT